MHDAPGVPSLLYYLFPSFNPLSVTSFFDSLLRLNRLAPGKPEYQKVRFQGCWLNSNLYVTFITLPFILLYIHYVRYLLLLQPFRRLGLFPTKSYCSLEETEAQGT